MSPAYESAPLPPVGMPAAYKTVPPTSHPQSRYQSPSQRVRGNSNGDHETPNGSD